MATAKHGLAAASKIGEAGSVRCSGFGAWEPRMSRTFILLGLILVAAGLLWPWIGRLGLGRLPGDIVVERENYTLFVPITTGLLISVVVTLFLWLVNR
ncbi:MAG: DUF2905 domain-containing protein [Methylocella sp.]